MFVKKLEGKIYSTLLILFILLFIDLIIGDVELFLMINKEIANPTIDLICLYILVPLFSLLLLIPLFLFLRKEYRQVSLTSFISGLLSYFIGSLIKPIVKRPRPFEILSARLVGPWSTTTFSFPSTTTALAFGLAVPFILKNKKPGILLLILSSLVGFSVVYTGFHFPLDAIGGAFLSIGISFLVDRVFEKVYKRKY